jgi:hypothetical protein
LDLAVKRLLTCAAVLLLAVGYLPAAASPPSIYIPSGGWLLQSNNLSDLTNVVTARGNLLLGTAATANTGTSGANLPFLNGTNTWSGLNAFTANVTLGSSGLAATDTLKIQSAAGQTRQLQFQSGTANRWVLSVTNGSESGSDAGSDYNLFAYHDDGSSSGILANGKRASGPVAGGAPYFSAMAAATHGQNRATTPNGTSGDYFNITDTQPTSTLGSNPIATTNGSPNVVITWTGHGLNTSANVTISGATAVGGITLSGAYRITAATANTVTVNAGSNASSTATGGGAAAQITPDFSTAGVRFDFHPSGAGSGFTDGMVGYTYVDPSHYITVASGLNGPQYQGMFWAALSPSDNSQLNAWGLTGFELDVVNRGADEGYQPDIFTASRPVMGLNIVPENLSQFTGNEGKNATVALVIPHNVHANSTGYWAKWYQGIQVAPDALVSNTAGVAGRGGIGADIFGAYEPLASNPFTTTNGSTTVTVTVSNSGTGSLLTAHNTPTSVYIPTTVVVRGVTIAAGVYAVSNVTATTFDITGSGAASSSGVGGSTTVAWVSFANDVPYAPAQWSGEFAHGLIATNAKFDDGLAINVNGKIEGTAFNVGGADGADCPAGVTAGTVVVVKGIVTHC